MIKGVKREIYITEKDIFSKISEYDIFMFYMPNNNWKVGQITYSPFRNENHPSFIISFRQNKLSFIDFADTDKKGNCFDFVKKLFNLSSFKEAVEKIDADFNLGFKPNNSKKDYKKIIVNYKQPVFKEKDYAFIQVKPRKFTKEELDYWSAYYQDENDLKKNNVYSIQEVYLNKERIVISPNELRFGYLYNGSWKIYRPYGDKLSKWFPNNVPITTMDGLDDIKNCDVAFITKSKKDYMVMSKILPNCCAVQNEGIACFSEENVEYIKNNSNKQILSFDSDAAGVKNSIQITEKFDFDYCNVPQKYLKEGINDWADLAKKHGLGVIEKYLTEKKILKK